MVVLKIDALGLSMAVLKVSQWDEWKEKQLVERLELLMEMMTGKRSAEMTENLLAGLEVWTKEMIEEDLLAGHLVEE